MHPREDDAGDDGGDSGGCSPDLGFLETIIHTTQLWIEVEVW